MYINDTQKFGSIYRMIFVLPDVMEDVRLWTIRWQAFTEFSPLNFFYMRFVNFVNVV
jgi:hypothetical protein